VALRTAEVIGSESESFGFELDRFERDDEQGLELRGRWFGVRGRRFVRPTLTMRIDGAKHRLLADLEHKPWAAEDGEEWIASFSPAPPAGDTRDIELSVARDIVIPLSAPASVTSSPRPTGKTAAPARPETRPKARPADRVQKALELERAKARELRRALDDAETDRGRLAAQRDALTAERDGMRHDQARSRAQVAELQQRLRSSETNANTGLSESRDELEAERAETNRLRATVDRHDAVAAERDRLGAERDRLAAERDRLAAERKVLVTERDELIAERESMRHEHALLRQKVAELRKQVKTTATSANAGLSEAGHKLKAERAESKRLRAALESHSAVVTERDRLARELEAAVAEQKRLASQPSQPRAIRPETARLARELSARPAGVAGVRRRRETDWVARALVVVPLTVVLVILAVVLHLL
jgi:uncharacterized coiled-coil DUF342 family protein